MSREQQKNHNQEFLIERPTLFFARSQVVTKGKLLEYFTKKALDDLEKCGYIKAK